MVHDRAHDRVQHMAQDKGTEETGGREVILPHKIRHFKDTKRVKRKTQETTQETETETKHLR